MFVAPALACEISAPPITPRGTSCSPPCLTTFMAAIISRAFVLAPLGPDRREDRARERDRGQDEPPGEKGDHDAERAEVLAVEVQRRAKEQRGRRGGAADH